MAKETKSKWNRTHYFAREKPNNRRTGHYAFVYGQRKRNRKYLLFTHTPPEGRENEFERLQHNIDPLDASESYVKKRYKITRDDLLQQDEKSKRLRIHPSDQSLIKKYKK